MKLRRSGGMLGYALMGLGRLLPHVLSLPHFWPIDRDRILQVPIGLSSTPDRLIWWHSETGHFTIRSCYHMILEAKLRNNMQTNGSSSSMDWKGLWGLRLPPKIRVFLCLDILPLNAGSVRKRSCKIRCVISVVLLMRRLPSTYSFTALFLHIARVANLSL